MRFLVVKVKNLVNDRREIILDVLAGVSLAVALSLLIDLTSYGLGRGDAWIFFYGQF
jgi:hypothetical protein